MHLARISPASRPHPSLPPPLHPSLFTLYNRILTSDSSIISDFSLFPSLHSPLSARSINTTSGHLKTIRYWWSQWISCFKWEKEAEASRGVPEARGGGQELCTGEETSGVLSEEEIEVIFVVKVVICKKIFSPNLEEKVDCAHRRVLRVGGDGGGDLGDDGDDLGAAGGGGTRGRVGKAVHLR